MTSELRRHLPPTVLAIFGLFICAFGIPALFRAAGFDQPVQSSLPDAPYWMLVAFIVLIGPFGEEMVFRKWLIDGSRRLSASFLAASLISTALWTISHLPANLQAGLVYAASGLILCRLRYETGRLWPCVVAHIIYNMPAVFLLN